MSRPKHFWYYIVKKLIMSAEMREGDSMQTSILSNAMRKATERTLKLPNGEQRMDAVEAILIKQTDTFDSYALKVNYDRYTVVKWINSYVNMVGTEAGY